MSASKNPNVKDNLESRLLRIEQLLDQLGPSAPRVAAGDTIDLAAVTRIRAVSQRLELLAGEMSKRERSPGWDGADAVTARLILADLAEAVRAYRTVAATLDARLTKANDALRDAGAMLDRLVATPD